MKRLAALLAGVTALVVGFSAQALEVEGKIPLGEVHGRIDHLAVDVGRGRLYVAELGNDTVSVIDLQARKVIRRLQGLREPQGIAYEPSTDTVYIANGGDGSVRLFHGETLAPMRQIAVGSDADNVRVDELTHEVFVGYGSGALAVIDPTGRAPVDNIPLHAHPESFRLQADGKLIFVNVPDAHEIAVLDRTTRRQLGSWSTGNLRANFPMAVDGAGRVLVVFRRPPRLAVFRGDDGRRLSEVDTCGDADDVFVDSRHDRLYVICGEGAVDVLSPQGEGYRSISRVPTVPGARTGLFVPELDRLFVAVRAAAGMPAAIWVLRP